MQHWLKTVMFIVVFTTFCPLIAQANDTLLVFAGAGMRMPLSEVANLFEKQHKIKVIYDFEGSGRLGNKILAGQKPDVFIPGAKKWAKLLKEKGYVQDYEPIAYHIPAIIAPLDNTKVNSLLDFPKKDVRLVLGDGKACAIGRVSSRIFKKAGIDETQLNVVARGMTVKQVLHWVEGKNGDAGIVWHADAVQSGKVRIIDIPENINCIDIIPVCNMKKSQHPQITQKYINYLLNQGKEIFYKYGFKPYAN
ncbi:molybdate ABC transporter substrate-binding protein [Desulfovulcanus sp.]